MQRHVLATRHRQKPCGGRKVGKENASGADSHKATQGRAEGEANAASRGQTKQGFVDHIKNFALYPESNGKSLKSTKKGSNVIRFIF